MALNTKTFTQLVQGIAAAIEARAAGLVDFTVGSISRATAEAFAGTVLWLEALILALLATTRAQTSTGADLDSFVADFGAGPTTSDPTLIARLGAVAATGSVTFSRLSTVAQAVVPVGSTVSTQDGSQQYTVILDTGNGAYNAGLNGYVLAIATAAVTVKVAAVTAGAASNAVAAAINTITSAIPGIDAVTNASGFTNGNDAETDAAFLARFRSFIASLREATPLALAYVIKSLQIGVQCLLVEGLNYDGSTHKGFFYFVVDDGTGTPPVALTNAAGAIVDLHRAAGIEFAIYAPVVETINAAMTLVSSPTANHGATAAIVQSAVTTYLNTLPLGQSVYMSRVYQIAHDASPDVVEITGLTLNSGTSDITITNQQVAKAGTVTVT